MPWRHGPASKRASSDCTAPIQCCRSCGSITYLLRTPFMFEVIIGWNVSATKGKKVWLTITRWTYIPILRKYAKWNCNTNKCGHKQEQTIFYSRFVRTLINLILQELKASTTSGSLQIQSTELLIPITIEGEKVKVLGSRGVLCRRYLNRRHGLRPKSPYLCWNP